MAKKIEKNKRRIFREEIRNKGFPEPVPLTKELLDSLSWREGQILTNLANLAEKEKGLIEKINARAPTPSGVLIIDGAATICEDEDDWKVITMGLRQDLREVKEKIKVVLNEALDCGLGYLGIIQRQCVNYGVSP